jgi:predicted transcriptional regulator
MARKKATVSTPIPHEVIRSFQLESELHRRAVAFAEATDGTFSSVVRIALREYLERHGA